MKYERICIMDKQHYEYCPSCNKYSHLPRWMMSFCSDNCHDIFGVFCSYSRGEITKAEAKARLESLDTSRNELFREDFKKQYDEIMVDDAPKKRCRKRKKPDSEVI